METLYEFGVEIQKIREAANGIAVKGSENASLIVYIVDKCNKIIQSINNISEQKRLEGSGQNGNDKESIDKNEECYE